MKRNLICKQVLMAGVVLSAMTMLLNVPWHAQQASGMAPPGMEENTGPFSGVHGPKTFGSNPGSPEKPAVSTNPGEVQGVTRYANGLPMPGAEVVILNADVNIDRTVVSGSGGAFVFKDLKPGEYQSTARKEGFALSPTTKVVLACGMIVTVDLPLGPRLAVSHANTNSAGLMRTYNQSAYRVQPASFHLTPGQPSASETSPANSETATDAPKPTTAAAEQPLPAAVMEEIAENWGSLSFQQVASDLVRLTKLDLNSPAFSTDFPVTLAHRKQIRDVLGVLGPSEASRDDRFYL